MSVEVSVCLPERLIHRGSPHLTEFTMKNDDALVSHQFLNCVFILEKVVNH